MARSSTTDAVWQDRSGGGEFGFVDDRDILSVLFGS